MRNNLSASGARMQPVMQLHPCRPAYRVHTPVLALLAPREQIWRLPPSLTDVRRGEEGFLKKLSVAEDAGELLSRAS
jgi:hypothetical protein